MALDNPQPEPKSQPDTSVEERLEQALVNRQKEQEGPDSEEEQPDSETEGHDEAEEETEEVVEELFEIEHAGKKVQVPKELKDAFLFQNDYTKKTQSLAEERKYLAQQRESLIAQNQIDSAVAEQRAELHGLVTSSKQYEAAIQEALRTGDGNSAQALNVQYSMLQNQINQKAGEVRGMMEEQMRLLQEGKQQRRVRADEEALKRIPNFNQETKKDLVKAAKSMGFEDHEIGEVDDPRVYHALWKAAQWDMLQAKSSEVKTKVGNAPKTLPSKGQPTQSAKVASIKTARDTLRRTGRPEAAENLIERLLTKGKR